MKITGLIAEEATRAIGIAYATRCAANRSTMMRPDATFCQFTQA